MSQYVYNKGEKCYCRALFGYKQATILDVKVIYHYFDPCFSPSVKYEYLIQFKSGKIKLVKSKELF